jgi:hypothetical protein
MAIKPSKPGPFPFSWGPRRYNSVRLALRGAQACARSGYSPGLSLVPRCTLER